MTTPLPAFPQRLLSYISTHFKDTHPDAFRKDVDALVELRKQYVEIKPEAHMEIIKGLMRYYAQLVFLSTKFPSDIGLAFPYHLPFPPPYSLTPDAPISLPSLTFERCATLFNIAALYASLAASERREEGEGIKRALGFLSSAAGVLNHLLTTLIPILQTEFSAPHAAGYDMTQSFLETMREFVLAQAQECFWQQAVLQGSYKNGLIGKLSMKVSEYYKSALTSANSTPYPSAGFFPPAWMAHITIKQVHFEAAAQYRLSQEDLEKSRYGEEIARLRVAESLAKKGIDGRKGVAETVVTDLRNLLAAVKSALERAVRDNDLVYVCPIPSTSQLPPIVGVGMVKVLTPPEISDPVTWLMGGGAGMGPLFSGLVPYGVHLAISIYDDRKDTLVRELDGKRVELDGVAASTLQSLNLPGSIQALERPVGLPPSLLKKAEEVDSSGGSNKVLGLLSEVNRLSKSNSRILSEAMDILDQEATENETLLARQPHLAPSRPASHIANHHLITTAGQYNSTIKQAAQSDETVRTKWEDWRQLIEILEGGEDTMLDHVPSTSSSGSALPASVRPLRATLEDLDDRIAFRARLLNEAKRISETDDIRPVVLKEASKLAHGGSGDVKTEWFEEIFEQELGKFDRVQNDMEDEISKQEKLLEDIRVANENFLSERKEDPKIKEREKRLQEMDLAYWKWREINDNAEEGIKFYHSFAELLVAFKEACSQFLNSRRGDVGQITNRFDNMSVAGTPPPQLQQQQSYQSQPYQSPSPSPSTPPQLRPAPQGASFLAHPSSSQWQTTSDFLPPPPPPPILRSGGIQTQPRAPPPPLQGQYHENEAEMTPRRSTRNKATPTTIGDSERNPYQKGKRRAGGGVV